MGDLARITRFAGVPLTVGISELLVRFGRLEFGGAYSDFEPKRSQAEDSQPTVNIQVF